MGESLDGGGDPEAGYSMRGGHMYPRPYKPVPSLNDKDQTVFDETVAFNQERPGNWRNCVGVA